MRQFSTGATRDDADDKLDFEGFYSPLVVESYGRYMHKHRKQADGQLRDSDNWQKGIPREQYMKSMWRHFLDVWFIHRGHRRFDQSTGHEITMEDALNALMFNAQGYQHEVLNVSEDVERGCRTCAFIDADEAYCVGLGCRRAVLLPGAPDYETYPDRWRPKR